MAQYFFDKLHCLGRPGERVENGRLVSDAGFLANAPWLRYYSTRTSGSSSIIVIPPQTGLGSTANMDIVLMFRRLKEAADNFTNAGPSIVFRWQDSSNYFYFPLGSRTDTYNSPGIAKVVNGSTSFPGSGITVGGTALNSWTLLRLKLVGLSYYWAKWSASSAQQALTGPISGGLEGSTAGLIGLRTWSYDTEIDYAWISVGTDGDDAPLSGGDLSTTISGTVVDSDGNPAAREVRAFLRETGQMVSYTQSDATTGDFALSTPWVGMDHDVVCLDNGVSVIRNDLGLSRVVPV